MNYKIQIIVACYKQKYGAMEYSRYTGIRELWYGVRAFWLYQDQSHVNDDLKTKNSWHIYRNKNKIFKKKYHTVGTNIEIVERGKTDTSNTRIHDRALSCLGTGSSSGGVKLAWWNQKSPLC